MAKIGLICSHGGHLTEMLQLTAAFEGHEVFFVTYRCPRGRELAQRFLVYELEGVGTNPWRIWLRLPAAWRILTAERPAVLVSTGSEIAVPFFVLGRVLGMKTIFVESWCRVNTPSRTGRALYPLADVFLVQWPQLLAVYGAKARYEGGLL